MAAKWIELVTGSWDDKRKYKELTARIAALPGPYREAAQALERYLMYFGAISKGDVMVRMLGDLADLFEQSAADAVPIHGIVGDDAVEFAEAWIRNYADGQWINKERERLTTAIERAAQEQR